MPNAEISAYLLKEDPDFPNNDRLHLMIYKGALPEKEPGDIEKVLKKNKWHEPWRNGIYHYHHYHSTAHEVLVVYNGHAKVQFGGPNGISVELNVGDVVIIPAGVAHKNLLSDSGFKCIGAYPEGQEFDMNYGKEGERPGTDKKIRKVPLPIADPVYGKDGPLLKHWSSTTQII